jgi:peptidyl-prolyl cis-trans isomerase B (cyclophilin B)
MGEIELELFDKEAPITVKNFVAYVKAGHYDGTIFHRVIPDFMAQGGGYTAEFEQKETNETIQNEANNGLKNERGTIAMARTNFPHSASSQFFINLVNNHFLDFVSETPQGWGYAVFGKVTKGMEVVDEMAKIPTSGAAFFRSDVPVTTIVIEKAEVMKKTVTKKTTK